MQCRAFGQLLKWWLPNRVRLTPWRPLQDVLSVLVNLVILRLTWQIVYDFCCFLPCTIKLYESQKSVVSPGIASFGCVMSFM